MMLLDIIKVESDDDFKLILTFENGEIKEFDCKPILNEKPFDSIANMFIFRQVRVEHGTVVWPNEVDIAPETLYLESRSISSTAV
jgi:hypothetical protein